MNPALTSRGQESGRRTRAKPTQHRHQQTPLTPAGTPRPHSVAGPHLEVLPHQCPGELQVVCKRLWKMAEHPCVPSGTGTNSEDPNFHALKGKMGRSFFQPKPGNQSNRLTTDRVGQWEHCKDSRKPQIRFHLATGQARQGGSSQHFLDLSNQ